MNNYHLAQVNVARFKLPKEDGANADFMNALDLVNAQAEAAPGFIWRLTGEGNDSTDIDAIPDDPQLIINMSVWTDMEALGSYVYRNPEHLAIMRRRKEWMEHIDVYQALWWTLAGHRPTVEEGLAVLQKLAAQAPFPEAFTFRNCFAAPNGQPAFPILDECA